MNDKPTPGPGSAYGFLRAALAVLVGCIALYLAVQLLRQIVVPLIVALVVVTTLMAMRAWRRHLQRSHSEW